MEEHAGPSIKGLAAKSEVRPSAGCKSSEQARARCRSKSPVLRSTP